VEAREKFAKLLRKVLTMCMSKHDQVGGGETEERGGEKGIGENDEGNVAEKRICFCSILSCLVLSCPLLPCTVASNASPTLICRYHRSRPTPHCFLPSCPILPVPSSLSPPPCPFLPVPSSLSLPPCSILPVPSSLLLPFYPFLPAPSSLPFPPCSFLSVPKVLVLGSTLLGRVKIPTCIACDRPLVERVSHIVSSGVI
jgi:hypothetical protein